MLEVYGVANSRAFRVLWLLEELGLPYRHHPVDFRDGGCNDPGYLAINPNGLIPSLRDDELVLWESMAINLYLIDRYGADSDLAPRDPGERGRLYQWTLWSANQFERPTSILIWHRRLLPQEDRDPEKARLAEHDLPRPLRILDDALADRAYLLGERFTLADLHVASLVYWLKLARQDLGQHLHITEWLGRCLAREARKAAQRK